MSSSSGNPLPQEVLEVFHDSYRRCLEKDNFFDVFYDRLVSSSEEVAKLFEGKPLERTKKMAKDALFFKLMASDGSQFGVRKLENLAETHKSYGVGSHLYDHWLECLLSTVEELDPHYSVTIDQAWRRVMRVGTDIMKKPVTREQLNQEPKQRSQSQRGRN